jgi:hypothetical protein
MRSAQCWGRFAIITPLHSGYGKYYRAKTTTNEASETYSAVFARTVSLDCCAVSTESYAVTWGGSRTDTYDTDTCVLTLGEDPEPTDYTITLVETRSPREGGNPEFCTSDDPLTSESSKSWNAGPRCRLTTTSVPDIEDDTEYNEDRTVSTFTFSCFDKLPPNPEPNECGTTVETVNSEQTLVTTYSDEYTDTELETKVREEADDFDDDFDDAAGSIRLFSCRGGTFQFRDGKYRVRHKLTRRSLATGCYGVDWVERFIPAITYDADPAGPCSTALPTGGGAAVRSVEVFAGGRGWQDGATITFGAPGNDGDTAEGTVEVDSDPESPTYGQITGISLTNAGSRYLSAPSVSLEGDGEGAEIGVHIGEETPKTYVWNGTIPPGYDATDPETYPTSEVYTPPSLTEDGILSVALARYKCEGCSDA